MNATEIIIPDNSCNEEGDDLDLSEYTKLKKLTVGDNCFAKLGAVHLYTYGVESITIGMNSFNGGTNSPDNTLHINGWGLKELRIGRYSFSNYSLLSIVTDPLEVVEIGDLNEESLNFQYGSLELSSLVVIRHSSVGSRLKSIVIGDKSFMYCKYAIFECELWLIVLNDRVEFLGIHPAWRECASVQGWL